MAATIEDLLTVMCPDLANSDSLDIYVEIAESLLSESVLGDNYNLAVALRAAHEYTVDVTQPLGSGGQVIQETEGKSTIMYASPSKRLSSIETTQYGRRLKNLYRTLGLVATTNGG